MLKGVGNNYQHITGPIFGPLITAALIIDIIPTSLQNIKLTHFGMKLNRPDLLENNYLWKKLCCCAPNFHRSTQNIIHWTIQILATITRFFVAKLSSIAIKNTYPFIRYTAIYMPTSIVQRLLNNQYQVIENRQRNRGDSLGRANKPFFSVENLIHLLPTLLLTEVFLGPYAAEDAATYSSFIGTGTEQIYIYSALFVLLHLAYFGKSKQLVETISDKVKDYCRASASNCCRFFKGSEDDTETEILSLEDDGALYPDARHPLA